MVYYNLSNVTAANNFYSMSVAINDLSNGLLFSTVLLSIGLFFLRRGIINGNYTDSLIGTSFITMIIGVLFWGSDLFGIPIITYPIILLIASIIIKIIP